MRAFLVFITIFLIFTMSNAETNRYYLTKSNHINARTGPENFYNIKITYKKKYLILKILNEYDEWYQTEDLEGEKAWIHKNFLSKQKKKKYITIKDKNGIVCYKNPDKNSKIAFESEYLVNFQLKNCQDKFCLVSKEKIEGWCEKEKLWGL